MINVLASNASFIMFKVVIKTRMEKKKVQIGSMIVNSGAKYMVRDAINTPQDCTKSLITWINAARTLMFSEEEIYSFVEDSVFVWPCPWPCKVQPILKR